MLPRRRFRPLRWAWLLAALPCLAGVAIAENNDGEYAGTEVCEVCHADVVESFPMTAHAVAAGWELETACETCHGPGAAHVESGGESDMIRIAELTPREQSDLCLTCHSQQEKQFTARHSTHKISDVSCIDCHAPHSEAPNMLDESGVDLCRQCHMSIVSEFDLPRAHPLGGYPRYADGGDLACAACHDTHTTMPLRARGGAGTAVCVDCHNDKAGPFVYPHDVSLVDGCKSCHRVHGSPNRHLLTQSRQVNLCYQCHPGTTTPGFHSAPQFLNEKCTACHMAIHGSNTTPTFLEE